MTKLHPFTSRSVALLAALAVSPAMALATKVRVRDFKNNPVPNAHIFVNGGGGNKTMTDAKGIATLPLKKGDKLIARKFIRTGLSPKYGHKAGSDEEWAYRVYITSATIANNGVVSQYVVDDPAKDATLVIQPDNTVFALNWVISCEWDMTNTEREEMIQRMRDASKYLYSATDGQFYIENVYIYDMAYNWNNADAKASTDYRLRANVNSYGGGFVEKKKDIFSYMNMARVNSPATYIHEFGHYGLALPDEYKDDDASAVCTGLLETTHATYKEHSAKASCMMHNQKAAGKICSASPFNPHNTKLSDLDCWQRIVNLYKDPAVGLRYAIRTPKTRGLIMGKVELPAWDWAPKFTMMNKGRSNLVEPITMITVGKYMGKVAKRNVYSQERPDGRFLRQGHVWYGSAEPKENVLPLAGLHVGDTILTEGNLLGTVKAEGVIAQAGSPTLFATLQPLAIFQSASSQGFTPQIDPSWLPMQVGVGLTKEPGSVEVVVKSPSAFSGTPTVQFQAAGQGEGGRVIQKPVALRQSDPTTFTGRLTFASGEPMEGLVVVTGAAADGRKSTVIREFAAGQPDTSGFSQVADPTGALIVRMATPAVTTGERVGVGSSEAPEPEMAGWMMLVEPKKVTRQVSDRFNAPVSLVFQAGGDETGGPSMTERLNLEYRIVRWNGTAGWTPVETVQHTDLEIATCATSTTGHFALMARPRATAASAFGSHLPIR